LEQKLQKIRKNKKEIKMTKNPNVVCWKCNQKRHTQTNCLKNKQQQAGIMATQKEKAKATETEVSFVAMNESTKNGFVD
jgi:hypothetical protein